MKTKRIVIKIGTNLLTREDKSGILLNTDRISALVRDISAIKKTGWETIIVTSGAIASGAGKVGLKSKPRTLPEKQAAAAVGQPLLMKVYEKYFSEYGFTVAQLLLTRSDFEDRNRYVNVNNTLAALLEQNIIPVINENDTVSVEEIKFGDNDTLAALVAVSAGANILAILTDVEGLCTSDPNKDKNAVCIREVRQITPEIERIAGTADGARRGTGGMKTKLSAAEIASKSGIETIVCNGRKEGVIAGIASGRRAGTRFIPSEKIPESKKRWIAFGSSPRGRINVDDGAREALKKGGRSLLPSGIVSVSGRFCAGETVTVTDSSGKEIARGISNYSSEEIEKIKGRKTSEIEKILGQRDFDEVIHRNNMVIV